MVISCVKKKTKRWRVGEHRCVSREGKGMEHVVVLNSRVRF